MNPIKDMRKNLNMSQFELSQKTGLSQSIISSYERGDKRPGADAIISLCDALDCTADELLGRKAAT